MSKTQVGGDHYTKLGITPFDYSMANGLDAMQHTAIKYITRFRDKNGIVDLEKARDTIDQLIKHEGRKTEIDEHDLLAKLIQDIPKGKYRRIITTGRGGSWLAAQLGYALRIPEVFCLPLEDCEKYLASSLSHTLFADSIVDSGATVANLEVDVACLVVRDISRPLVKYLGTVAEGKDYINFPVGQYIDTLEKEK